MFEFKFPDVGEGLEEGKLIKWLVKEGEAVKVDQPIAEVETDKAVVELPAPHAGVITKLLANAADTLHVGDVIMHIDTDAKSDAQIPSTQKPPIQESPTKVEHKAVVEEVVVDEGDVVPQKPEEKPLEVINDKVNKEVVSAKTPSVAKKTPSRYGTAGILAMPNVRKEARDKGIALEHIQASGKHGQILMSDLGNVSGNVAPTNIIDNTMDVKESSTQKTSKKSLAPSTDVSDQIISMLPRADKKIIATPSTRRLARDLGVDINKISESVHDRRITSQDVQLAAGNSASTSGNIEKNSESNAKSNTHTNTQNNSDGSSLKVSAETSSKASCARADGEVERIPLSGIRKAISRKMLESQDKSAQLFVMDEVDVTALVELRNREKERLSEQGVKLTYLPFIVKAVVVALQQFPYFNAVMDDEKQEILLKKFYNIGIATDTKDGLMVPVIANAKNKSIVEIANEIAEHAEQARNRSLSREEMSNGTFTITSVGNIAGQGFNPILNYPEVGILGVGRIVDKPALFNGEIVARKIMTLSLVYDHRVIDGADASRFLMSIMSFLEDPNKLFMEMM